MKSIRLSPRLIWHLLVVTRKIRTPISPGVRITEAGSDGRPARSPLPAHSGSRRGLLGGPLEVETQANLHDSVARRSAGDVGDGCGQGLTIKRVQGLRAQLEEVFLPDAKLLSQRHVFVHCPPVAKL